MLNSKVLWYFIKNTSNAYNNSYYYFKTKYLAPFSLPVCSSVDQAAISERVRAVLRGHRSKESPESTAQLESEIDKLVYKLYRLSASEIKLVEDAAPW